MQPKKIGSHQLIEKLDRLPWGAQRNVANDQIGQFPKQEQTDNKDRRIAKRRSCLFLHHFWPLLESSTLSQCERRLLAAIDRSRISRIRGYIVALSKFV